MASYLTEVQAEARLDSRFGIEASPLQGDIEIASLEFDAKAPFIGYKQVTDGTQPLAFPRTLNPDGTTNTDTTVPDAILDWVALTACRVVTEDRPPLTSRSARGLSESFAYPMASKVERRLEQVERAVGGHLLRVGQRIGTSRYATSESEASEATGWYGPWWLA